MLELFDRTANSSQERIRHNFASSERLRDAPASLAACHKRKTKFGKPNAELVEDSPRHHRHETTAAVEQESGIHERKFRCARNNRDIMRSYRVVPVFFTPLVSSYAHLNEYRYDARGSRREKTCPRTKFTIPCFVRTKLNEFVAASPPRPPSLHFRAGDNVGKRQGRICNRDYAATSTSGDAENDAGGEKQFTKRVKGKCKDEK